MGSAVVGTWLSGEKEGLLVGVAVFGAEVTGTATGIEVGISVLGPYVVGVLVGKMVGTKVLGSWLGFAKRTYVGSKNSLKSDLDIRVTSLLVNRAASLLLKKVADGLRGLLGLWVIILGRLGFIGLYGL